MRNYHEYPSICLGGSDSAHLRYVIHDGNNGESVEGYINFGEDGNYTAHVVDDNVDIPACYKRIVSANINNAVTDGFTIYDDDTDEPLSFVRKCDSLHQYVPMFRMYEIDRLVQVNVYRCGMRGCIIQLMTFDDFESNKEVI